MLTLTHFVLVRKETLFPMLEDAGKLLVELTKTGPDQRHYIPLVTGPSRTADIERTLTAAGAGCMKISAGEGRGEDSRR